MNIYPVGGIASYVNDIDLETVHNVLKRLLGARSDGYTHLQLQHKQDRYTDSIEMIHTGSKSKMKRVKIHPH